MSWLLPDNFKADGRIVPQIKNPTLADANFNYQDVQGVDIRVDEPMAWLVTVGLDPMSIAEIGPDMQTKLARGANVSVIGGNPESPPIPVGVTLKWGTENVLFEVDVDVGRGVTIPVYGTRVFVKGLGSYVAVAGGVWPSALLVSAVPDTASKGQHALRRSIQTSVLAASTSTPQAIPRYATRAELTQNAETVGGQVVVNQITHAGTVVATWVFPPTAAAASLIPDQTFPIHPSASEFTITNNGAAGAAFTLGFDLAL
jgi:hypothetical protein